MLITLASNFYRWSIPNDNICTVIVLATIEVSETIKAPIIYVVLVTEPQKGYKKKLINKGHKVQKCFPDTW